MFYEKIIAHYRVEAVDPSRRPPKRWWSKMSKKIAKNNPSYDAETVRKTVGKIWYGLSETKKAEIRHREGKRLGDPSKKKKAA